MYVWAILIILSSLFGSMVAIYINNKFAWILAGFIPWVVLLIGVLYSEYFLPYQGGGASMWPVAQLFGGTAAAIIGVIAYKVTLHFRR